MNAIPVTPYYSNAKYYLAMPRPVFDALEAAYLAGADSAEVSPELYAAFIANIKSADLCPELL